MNHIVKICRIFLVKQVSDGSKLIPDAMNDGSSEVLVYVFILTNPVVGTRVNRDRLDGFLKKKTPVLPE